MKRFNRWLNRFAGVQRLYAAVGRGDGLWCREVGGRPHYGPSAGRLLTAARPPAGLPEGEWLEFLRQVAGEAGGYDRSASWVLAGLAADGVKVFAPTTAEFDALARVAINIGWDDYRQPFDTFVTLIPETAAPGLTLNGWQPVAVVSRADHAGRVVAQLLVGDHPAEVAAGVYCWPAETTATIEETFAAYEEVEFGDVRMESAFDTCRRAALNACLALTQFGVRRQGFANPEFAERLAASLLKRRVPEAVKEANRSALRLIPEVYAFTSDVRLHDTAGGGPAGDDQGGERRTHWRRGHWARTACGTRRAARRLVFRRPTMVNAHRFRGDPADTLTRYST